MNVWSLAARNVTRNKFRTTLTILGVAFAIVAFVFLRTMVSSWNVAVEHSAKDRIGTRHKVSWVVQLPKRYIDGIRQVPGVAAATWANWFGGQDPRDEDNFFATLAVDPATYLDVYDEMVVSADERRRWIEDRQGAIVGDMLAKNLGVKPGDRFTLKGTIYPGNWQFNVIGVYKATRKSVDRSQFLFHWNYLNETLPEYRRDEIGWVISRVNDPLKTTAISAAIDKVFDEQDIQTLSMSEKAMNMSFMGMITGLLKVVNWISIIILFILVMILGNTVAMGVRERTNEYGILRALGFFPHHIRIFVYGEALTLGLLAGLLGIAIAFPLVELMFGRWLEENMGGMIPYFRIEPVTYAAAIGFAVVLAAAAATLPARKAGRLVVADAIRRIA